MAIEAEEVLKRTMSKAQRREAAARAETLKAEYETLQALRKAMGQTQAQLARELGIGQDNVSRIERRSDLLLSTLRGYVAAMGGELELTVRFPGHPPVTLEGLSESRDSGA